MWDHGIEWYPHTAYYLLSLHYCASSYAGAMPSSICLTSYFESRVSPFFQRRRNEITRKFQIPKRTASEMRKSLSRVGCSLILERLIMTGVRGRRDTFRSLRDREPFPSLIYGGTFMYYELLRRIKARLLTLLPALDLGDRHA